MDGDFLRQKAFREDFLNGIEAYRPGVMGRLVTTEIRQVRGFVEAKLHCPAETHGIIREMDEGGEITKAGDSGRNDRLTGGEIFPKFYRIQAFRKRAYQMWNNADVKGAHVLGDFVVPDRAGKEDSRMAKKRQIRF